MEDIIHRVDDDTPIDADVTDEGLVRVSIGDDTYDLTSSQAAQLKKRVVDAHDESVGLSNQGLVVARSKTHYQLSKHPYHLQGEYGCKTHQNASIDPRPLNLYAMGRDIRHDCDRYGEFWKRDRRDNPSRVSIETVISAVICQSNESILRFWHKQRKIFLPKVIENTSLEAITDNRFQHVGSDSSVGGCDTCGTAQSGVYVINLPVPHHIDIRSPLQLCPTCKDLLVASEGELPIEESPLTRHPVAAETDVLRPFTDPDPDDGPSAEDDVDLLSFDVGDVGAKQRADFIEFVKGLDGDEISKWTGRNLFNGGYNSIRSLHESSVTEIKRNTGCTTEAEIEQVKAAVESLLKERCGRD